MWRKIDKAYRMDHPRSLVYVFGANGSRVWMWLVVVGQDSKSGVSTSFKFAKRHAVAALDALAQLPLEEVHGTSSIAVPFDPRDGFYLR